MENMLGRNPAASLLPSAGTSPQAYLPRFDVRKPKEEDLDISLTGNQLVISGRREFQAYKDANAERS